MTMAEVEVELRDGVAVVALNRPASLNAWTTRMQAQVADELLRLGADDGVLGVIVTGAGERAFCAGQDLAETARFTAADVAGWLDGFKRVYDAALSCPKPVVAALNGVAAGSGYQLALVCDVRLACTGARIGQPEVRSGIPSVTGHYLTQLSLGHSRTTEMMLSGRLLDAAEALSVGLVHQVVGPAELAGAADECVRRLAAAPTLAFALSKRRIRDSIWPGLLESFEAALAIDEAAWSDGEPQRVAGEFFQRRGPHR